MMTNANDNTAYVSYLMSLPICPTCGHARSVQFPDGHTGQSTNGLAQMMIEDAQKLHNR